MLAYHDEMGNVFLFRDGAGERFLTTTAAERPGSFSPDGRYLAYTSSESGRPEIYVRTAPDAEGGRWQVSTGGGDEAVFSGDGSELFYRNPNAGKMIAVRIELEPTFTPGEQTELFSDRFRRSTDLPAYDYDVEKKRFLMVQWSEQETIPRIHVVLNWSAELKRLVPTDN